MSKPERFTNATGVHVPNTNILTMIKLYSRRNFLRTALAAGALSILPRSVRAASPVPKRLVVGTRVIEVNGRSTKVFGLTGPDGRPGIRLAPGERFRVDLVNQAGTRTIPHWHGQLPPWTQDGFPWPQTPPIANGNLYHMVTGMMTEFRYEG